MSRSVKQSNVEPPRVACTVLTAVFLGQSVPLDFRSPMTPNLGIVMGQAKTLPIFFDTIPQSLPFLWRLLCWIPSIYMFIAWASLSLHHLWLEGHQN